MMVLLLGTIALAAAAAEDTMIPAAACRAIAETNAAWLQAMKRHDAAAIAAIYGDEAVFITSTGETLRGRVAIERFERERFNATGRVVDGTIEEDGLAQTGVTRRYVSRGTTEICVRSPDTSSRSGPLIQVAAPESFGTSLCRESTSRGSLERARPPSNAQSLPSRASPRSFFRRLRSDALNQRRDAVARVPFGNSRGRGQRPDGLHARSTNKSTKMKPISASIMW